MKKQDFNRKILEWKKKYDKTDDLPTLASFLYYIKKSKSTMNTWKETKPELYKNYIEKVVPFVEYKLTEALINSKSKENKTAIIFYLKAALKYREFDYVNNASDETPTIIINTTNSSSINLKENNTKGDSIDGDTN